MLSKNSFWCVFLLPLALIAQVSRDVAPLKYWPAPLYWQPTAAERSMAAKPEISGYAASEPAPRAQTPVHSLVFVGMTPCRLVDTRGNGFTGSFGPPSLQAERCQDQDGSRPKCALHGFCLH